MKEQEYTYNDDVSKEDVGKNMSCILCSEGIEIEPVKSFKIDRGKENPNYGKIDTLGAWCRKCNTVWIGKSIKEIEEQMAMDIPGGERYECRERKKND